MRQFTDSKENYPSKKKTISQHDNTSRPTFVASQLQSIKEEFLGLLEKDDSRESYFDQNSDKIDFINNCINDQNKNEEVAKEVTCDSNE